MSYYTPTCRPLEAPPEYRCDTCGSYDCDCQDERLCDNCGTVNDNGEDWCDRCIVVNAQACGDWDGDSIAAHRRLFPDASTC